MLFGRPVRGSVVGIDGLEQYLDRCFDEEVGKTTARMPRLVGELARAFSDFGAAVREFSEKESKPSMEYLYMVKEGFVSSQRPNYTNHIIRIAATRPEPKGSNLYSTAKAAAEAYGDIIMEVLKANNTFKVVIIGYAEELKDVKRHFNTMERLHKNLNEDLALCDGKFSEYMGMRDRIGNILGDLSRASRMDGSLPEQHDSGPVRTEGAEELEAEIHSLESERESAKSRKAEAASSITRMLLPMGRIARKHDHMSPSKRKLGDYIDRPSEITKDAENLEEFRGHVSSMIEEVRTGKIGVRSPEQTISQLSAARDADFTVIADSLHRDDLELKRINERLAKARETRSMIERANESERQRARGKDEAQRSLEGLRAGVLTQKSEIESLFMSVYRKRIEIRLEADMSV